MQDVEARQRELRNKLANAQISNARGLPEQNADPDAIFSPLNDYVERRRPITRLFFSVYDNLGTLLVINFFTFILSLPLLYVLWVINFAATRHQSLVPLLPIAVIALCIAAPAWGAASSYCSRITEEQMRSIGDYWRDYRRLALKSILLGLAQWATFVVLLVAAGWYLSQRGPGAAIGILCLYLLLMWALLGLYVWPLMVRGYRWGSIVRNAAVLVFAAPVRTFGIFIVLLILTAILTVTGIGLAVLALSLWAMLPNQALILTREKLERGTTSRK